MAFEDMPGEEEVKSGAAIAVPKEEQKEDYVLDMQSLGRLLLSMSTLEDINSLKSGQRPAPSALYSHKLQKHVY